MMGGKRSRDKGKRGEREARDALIEHLICSARRGQQHCGGPGSPDVVTSIRGTHFEVKRTETLSIYAALQQAIDDAGSNVPVVLHRRNNKPWLAIVELSRLRELAERILEER
jgi:hypothetical protein